MPVRTTPLSPELAAMKKTAQNTVVFSSPAGASNMEAKNRADTRSPAANAIAQPLKMMHDLWGGTPTMRAGREAYLPRSEAESLSDYDNRLRRAEFFNALRQTIEGYAGMVFRRDPQLADDISPTFQDHWENIDNAGTHGAVFAQQVFLAGVRDGGAVILVDYPDVPSGLTLAQEREQGLRPYWVQYDAKRIVSSRVAWLSGIKTLTQLVLEECATEPDGDFGEREVVRFRVFRLVDAGVAMMREMEQAGVTPDPEVAAQEQGHRVVWELWQYTSDDRKELTQVASGVVRNQTRIPAVHFAAGETIAWGFARPRLEDLAYTNIAHYQVKSDHRFSLHKASVPILVMKGRDRSESQVVVGPNMGIDVSVEGDVKYVEHAGSALNASRTEIQDLEAQMATQGLSLLQRETRAAETAQAKRIDKSAQDSTLAKIARALQDALEQAIEFHAAYLGEEPGSVAVNMDFEALTFDPAFISALSNLQLGNQISLETLWEMLAAGDILPDTFDAAKEQERIDAAHVADAARLATLGFGGAPGLFGSPPDRRLLAGGEAPE